MLKKQGYPCLDDATQSVYVKMHMSVPCFGLKPSWLSVVDNNGEMQDKI